MSKITNNPTIKEEKIDLARACMEHRGTWMALTYDEMEKCGYDAEKVTRAAILKCGNIHGLGYKAKCENPNSAKDFTAAFLTENVKKCYEVEIVDVDENKVELEFHYCPQVNAWRKLGYDDEKIALLCDIAMEGDRGIADGMDMKLEITDTIAKGCPTCKICYHK